MCALVCILLHGQHAWFGRRHATWHGGLHLAGDELHATCKHETLFSPVLGSAQPDRRHGLFTAAALTGQTAAAQHTQQVAQKTECSGFPLQPAFQASGARVTAASLVTLATV